MTSGTGGLRLITFDLDDTLWPCLPVIRAAEQAMYQWLQVHAPRITDAYSVPAMRAHRVEIARARPSQAHDMTWLRVAALREQLHEHRYDEDLVTPALAVFREARDRVEPFGEVIEVLTRLRERFLLVSVTNGNARVENTPLRGLFHHSLAAADVGAAKPHPALFEASLAFAGVGPGEALHVGDDAELDVVAAREFGMGTVWLDRYDRQWSPGLPEPDLTLSDLLALEAHLTRTLNVE